MIETRKEFWERKATDARRLRNLEKWQDRGFITFPEILLARVGQFR